MKISRDELKRSIIKHGGVVTRIAAAHGITVRGLRKRIAENPDLREALEEARDQLIDEAEAGLRLAVKDRKAWAIKLALTTIGAKRGFGRKLEVESHARGRIILRLPDSNRRLTPLKGDGLVQYETDGPGAMVHIGLEPEAETLEIEGTTEETTQTATRAEPESN